MNEKLISADEVLAILRSTMCEMACKDNMITAVINLPPRHEKERGDGLREAFNTISDYDSGLLNNYGGGNVAWWQDYIRSELERCNCHWRESVDAVLINRSPTPQPQTESLAELADRKGWWVARVRHYPNRWVINLDTLMDTELPHGFENPVIAPTYPAAEQAARRFLEGLEDVK